MISLLPKSTPMSLNKFVKIGSISNLSDARYCAGMMVDILGFEIVDPSREHYVDSATFSELTEWVAGVAFVGECHDTDLETLEKAIDDYPIQYIELNQLELLEQIADRFDQLIIFHIKLDSLLSLESLQDSILEASRFAELIIIDAVPELDSRKIEADLKQVDPTIKLLKAYDLDIETVKDLSTSWYGIELKGSPEEKAGYKEYGIVMDILEELEVD